MKTKASIIFTASAYILMLVAMFLLPLINGSGQSVIEETLYNPGPDPYCCSWLLNSTIVILALTSAISGWKWYKGFAFQRLILVLFGSFIVLTTFSNQILGNLAGLTEIFRNELNSCLTSTAWLTFIILAFSTALMPIGKSDKLVAGIAGSAVLILILMDSEAESTAGLWQRLLFTISFGWMVYVSGISGSRRSIR